jgi:NOL1/NOP2/sun family putative RNA methylase
MAIKLPGPFTDKISRLLGAETEAFLASYEEPKASGLRVNTLKLAVDEFQRRSPFRLAPVPWAPEGFYVDEGERPGKHPYYHAGLYYIQEPSAMAPVELLGVRPGDKVLDLCGAPGGKSTQIAAKLRHEGLLVANDNHPDRVKAMVKNIELFGVRNAVVTNELPERLADRFPYYFDKILVDAPCSGEGMFRKEPDMAKEWTPASVERYAAMQLGILGQAARMLSPGGRLVYSTCTFSPEENEAVIAQFLDRHPDFRVVPVEPRGGLASGRPDWVAPGVAGAEAVAAARGTVRLWPHRLRGEGHFAAVLERAADSPLPAAAAPARRPGGPARADRAARVVRPASGASAAAQATEALYAAVRRFGAEQLAAAPEGPLAAKGDYVYQVPPELPDLAGLRVVRPGWFLGTVRRDRFEPSHALAMGLAPGQAARSINLGAGSSEAIRYLKGETLQVAESSVRRAHDGVSAKGYCLVCLDGYPVGWGKWQDGMLKNEYPPAWRWT